MKASWEKTEKNQGVLTVEVGAEEVAKALDQAFYKVVKKVSVPGFRKGKVPRPLFEKRFGVEVLYEDALDLLLPDAYANAVKETGIEAVDQPEIDIEQLEKGKPFIFKATVTVKPEVELGEYKGLQVPAKDFTVKAEDIEEELKKMQQRQEVLEAVEEGTVEDGDQVIIDFEGSVNGELFEGGSAEGHTLKIGSGQFIPGFEEQVVGMAPEEEKEINVRFPDEYHAEELAGKEAVFRVKLHEIKRPSLPELDDDFAQDVSEFDTLDELKEDIENKLKEKAKAEEEKYIRNTLVELATANAAIDLPPVMIEHEIDHMVDHFAQQLRFQGITLEQYEAFTGQDRAALREQFKEDAEKQVRSSLVLEAIGKAEAIQVEKADIEAELQKLAEQMQRDVDEVREILDKQGNIDSIRNQILVNKTIDLLVSHSQNAA